LKTWAEHAQTPTRWIILQKREKCKEFAVVLLQYTPLVIVTCWNRILNNCLNCMQLRWSRMKPTL